MALSIDQIRAARTLLPKREVDTPDLGGKVWVRALTLKEVGEVQDLHKRPATRPADLNRRIVEYAACNEDGSALFIGEDKALIESLTWGTIDAIASAATELSGMRQGAEEDAQKK